MNDNSLCGRAVCLMDALCSWDVALPTFWHFGQKLGIIRGQLFLKPGEGGGYMRLTTRKSDVLYHYLFFFLPFLLQYFRLFCYTLNSTLVYFPQILSFSDFPHVFFHPELSGLCGISVNLCVTLCALTQCLWFKLLVFTEPKRDQQL